MINNFYDNIIKFYRIYYSDEKIIIYEIVSPEYFTIKYNVIINNLIRIELSFDQWEYFDEEKIFEYIKNETDKQLNRYFKFRKLFKNEKNINNNIPGDY